MLFIIYLSTINTADFTPLLYYQICPYSFRYYQNLFPYYIVRMQISMYSYVQCGNIDLL